MPATVLETLEDDGVYPNFYYGKNLLEEVPQDLYKQDWWYRTTFTAPAGFRRSSVWTFQASTTGPTSGSTATGRRQPASSACTTTTNSTSPAWIAPGQPNTLAVKVTPERAIQDVNGVELADSWYDWINWRYLGYQGPNDGRASCARPQRRDLETGSSQDIRPGRHRRRHRHHRTAAAADRQRQVTVYTTLHNYSDTTVRGVLRATISRPGKHRCGSASR